MRKAGWVLLLFVPLLLFACKKKTEPEVVTINLVMPTLSPSQVPTATPCPATPTPWDASIPTVTPEITFVPLPVSTKKPDKYGNTPSPTPEWAEPLPSPAGESLLKEETEAELATVLEDRVPVRKHAKNGGAYWGYALLEGSYRVLEEENGFVKILFDGEEGYVPEEKVKRWKVDLRQTDTIQYKVGTLNVHSVNNKRKEEPLAKFLKESQADIVGLQEVVRFTVGGDYKDWLELLAEDSGYPYYCFCQTLGYDGGKYGTAMLSKYPILSRDSWKLDVAKGKETRFLAHMRVLTENGALDCFNTHLCASDMYLKTINIASFVYMLRASGVKTYTVTGDFNCSPPRIHRYMKDIYFANIDRNTFGDGSRPKIIDNVLYTEGISVPHVEIYDTDVSRATDHKLLVADCYQRMP